MRHSSEHNEPGDSIHTEPQTGRGLLYWQERTLAKLLVVAVVLGTIAYVPSVLLSLKEELWLVAVLDTLMLALVYLLLFVRGIPYRWKATCVSGIAYLVGLVLLWVLGPFGAGPVWLFAFPIMTGILLGLRASVLAVGLNIVPLVGFGVVVSTVGDGQSVDIVNALEKWGVISVNFLLLNTLAAVGVASILRGLHVSLEHEQETQRSLVRRNEELRELTVNLQNEISERQHLEEQKRLMEAQMIHGQRLESIGTLASGVAHEINNPLNIMMNYAQLILDDQETSNDSREYATNVVKESERVARIVKNLLAFSRQEKEAHSPADVGTLVNATISLIGASFRKDQIALEVEIPEGLPKIRCRSQQIQQVLLNPLTNARDALHSRFPGSAPEKRIRLAAAPFEQEGNACVRLTVQDHGGGIPPDIAEHVFDPFFTTKPRERGTGLGLSISYGIVTEHLGKLWFETEPGVGTRFHVDLKVNNGWSAPGVAEANASEDEV